MSSGNGEFDYTKGGNPEVIKLSVQSVVMEGEADKSASLASQEQPS